MTWLLATRPELPGEHQDTRHRPFWTGPRLPLRRFSPPGKAQIHVKKAPAGTSVGYFPAHRPQHKVELLRLTAPVAPPQPGPRAAFAPNEAFGVYAGPYQTGRGLAVFPAWSPREGFGYLLIGPGISLLLTFG